MLLCPPLPPRADSIVVKPVATNLEMLPGLPVVFAGATAAPPSPTVTVIVVSRATLVSVAVR
jgi:hypothetical protein